MDSTQVLVLLVEVGIISFCYLISLFNGRGRL